MIPCVRSALNSLVLRFRTCSETPELDAQLLLAKILSRPRSWLAAHPEARLDPQPAAALEAFARRLEGGEPLPYLLGEWEFFGLPFYVTPDVLIPRPETELLVEHAIAWLRNKSNIEGRKLNVADIGTGSGCIAISLAVNVPEIRVTAADISPAALEVARRNAARHKVSDRITFLEADLFPDPLLSHSYSLIVANLPYIPTETLHNLPVFGREPTLALDGGADGLALIRRLLAESPAALAPGGAVLLEIEASQGQSAYALAHEVFPKASVKIRRDLSGHDRLIEIRN
jgi:release factor glutamine methyltransferase